ncbi:DUF305 domain-containing protein [Psychrobacter sp. F1192]|uniref:DUF305 domain-containing protein n=1 Tax=Psychrobacter coccoides TaxID=2818440 RepID=A0ABS3NMQ2_9GAMM|nr:DUF305 domain-containing protein [Psychrobacter coccoides]MBO1530370.1 DUF305 domain-containing protein [Psychrobacter coccoides]
MTSSYRFSVIAFSVTAALALSACQPQPEDTEPAATEEVQPSANVTPEVETPETTEAAVDINENEEETVVADTDSTEDNRIIDMLSDYTRALGRMQDEMRIGMGYNDPDTAFAKSMLGLHRGAVDMAQIQLKYGTDEEMRTLAEDIIENHQSKIDTMRRWLASHPDAARPKPNTEAMQQAYADDIEDMYEDMAEGITASVADIAFARNMLSLHVGAVDMALIQLKYGTDEEMRDLALQVIDAQQRRTQTTERWLATNDSLIESNEQNDLEAENESGVSVTEPEAQESKVE